MSRLGGRGVIKKADGDKMEHGERKPVRKAKVPVPILRAKQPCVQSRNEPHRLTTYEVHRVWLLLHA
jgi:hypothetical protein